MNRKSLIVTVFFLSVFLFSGIDYTLAQEYEVGVSVGQTAEYAWLVYGNKTIDYSLYPYQIEITVLEVSGKDVSFQMIAHYTNRSDSVTDFSVNIETGENNGRAYFIAANLTEGDLIYTYGEQTSIPKEGATINETITMTYLGENIEVNHWNGITAVHNSTTVSDVYWDKSTGRLLQLFARTETTEDDTYAWYCIDVKIDGLTETFNAVVDDNEYPIMVESNSSITDFAFNKSGKRISFNVNGAPETTGFCEVTIPNDLMWGTFSIYLDESLLVEEENYIQTNNGTHHTFFIDYNHSTHYIEIVGSDVIPEFSFGLMMLTIFTIVTVVITVYKKSKSTHNSFV